ncbi:MAG: hypothetical protein FD123_2050 [Bacteroidetes bacterium]|nr:MAG: hypothetical protein FD123_2050 [Bacteroidota bacterium]
MKHALLSFLLLLVFSTAEAGVVKGVVRDTTGQPVPYVAVLVKNSTIGVNTNLNGGYFLELKPGTYTLVFSQLGLITQEHEVKIGSGTVTLDVILKTASQDIGLVEISAKGDRDKGKEIMRKVIDNRDDYLDRVQNYRCLTYQKSSLEKVRIENAENDSLEKEEEKPEADTLTKAEKRKEKRKKLPADTTSRKYARKKEKQEKEKKEAALHVNVDYLIQQQNMNLIESYSETYFQAPRTFRENVIAHHDFAERKKRFSGGGISKTVEYGEHEIAPVQYASENPYLLISDAQGADFNFYRNLLDLPALSSRPLLSPAAATAMLSYRFEYMESFVENGKTIHRINVLPLFKSDALFAGSIFVQDSTWAIVSVNLAINPTVLLYCKEFRVILQYEEVSPQVFLPVRREFLYTIKEGKSNIIGNMRVDHTDYRVNGTIPPKTFTNEIKRYADDAFDKDSAWWVQHRSISLEDKEIGYIHRVDSLVTYYDSPEYIARQDSAYNSLDVWSFLLNGIQHRDRVKGYSFYISPLIEQAVPFGVGGYRHKLGGTFNKDFQNDMLLETEGQVDYGFLNKDVRGKAGVGLTYYPLKFVRTFVRFGDFYEMVNSYASLESVFSRSNYVRSKEFSVAQRMEIVNGLFGELSLEHSDQLPITGIKLEQWSNQLFGSLNTPSDFERYVKSEIRLELKYRFRQKYVIKRKKKIIVGSKYPELRAFYRKGIPGLLGSEVDFDYFEIGSTDEMKIGRFGTSGWSVLGGIFINKSDLRLLEHKYFRGSDSFIFSDPMRSFQLLGTTLSTANSFFRVNYIHHFEGAFGSKIPLFGKLKITAAAGGGLLLIPDQEFSHGEFFAGLERIVRIKKQLFRFGVFAATADNNLQKATLTWKIGIGFYNSYTKKWSY